MDRMPLTFRQPMGLLCWEPVTKPFLLNAKLIGNSFKGRR
jgi:hypothetical protein